MSDEDYAPLNSKSVGPNQNAATKLDNESIVFKVFGGGEKFTIKQAYEELIRRDRNLSGRTVRRAIDSLAKKGFLELCGREGNANIYRRVDSSYASSEENQPLIPLGPQEFYTVEEFYKLVVNVESSPLDVGSREKSVFSHEKLLILQRIMAFTVMSAGESGHDAELQKSVKQIYGVIHQLDFASKVLKHFVESSIYYDHYRDRISFEDNRVAERNPELHKLVIDFIKGG